MASDTTRAHPFLEGDPRFIYATRRGSGDLFELPEGEAEQHRAFAKTQLMCPIPGCPSPDITTVGPTYKRHHFRHLRRHADVEHSPETYFHLESKAVVAAWARATYPQADVVIEQPSNPSRERIADVMVTFPDRRRYAIEVQFSSLNPSEFTARHLSYREQGINDVWLFVHAGCQLRVGWDGTPVVKFSPLHRAVAATGAPVLWINPFLKHIGYAVEEVWTYGRGEVRVPGATGGVLHTEALGTARLTESGLTFPQLEELLQAKAVLDKAEEAERARRAEWKAQHADQIAAQEARREEVKSAARALREDRQRFSVIGRRNALQRENLLTSWPMTAAGQAAAAAFPDEWPYWLDKDFEIDLPVPARLWQWFVYSEVLPSIPEGEPIDRDWVVVQIDEYFPGAFEDRAVLAKVTLNFLHVLAHHQKLRPVGDTYCRPRDDSERLPPHDLSA